MGKRENLRSGCQGGDFCTKKKLWQKLQFRKKLWEVWKKCDNFMSIGLWAKSWKCVVNNSCGKLCGKCGKLTVINRYSPPLPGGGSLWRSFGFGLRKFREGANGCRETGSPKPWGYGKKRTEKFCLSRITLSKPSPARNPSPKVCEKMPNLPGGHLTAPGRGMYVSACAGNTSFVPL